jgi:hypothetical protein
MTLSSRPRLFARFAPVALAAAILGLAVTGCEDKHIGRLCSLETADDGGVSGTGANATINAQAVECPSRICLLPAAEKTTTTAALCTADCQSDDDCADGETANASDKSNPHCKTGFVCMRPTTVGSFCCRPLCVCRDFVEVPVGGYKLPPVCMPGTSTCQNVH